MTAIKETAAMRNIKAKLMTERNTTESSADLYMAQLIRLNDKRPFRNITFLKDTNTVLGKLSNYALSTRKSILGGLVSVLSLFKSGPYRKLTNFYREKMLEAQKALDEDRGDTTAKTEKEQENWVDWNDVEKKRDILKAEVAGYGANLTPGEYDRLLAYLLLSLYTRIPPRRNMDWQQMWVVRQWTSSEPTDRNYLDLHGQRFIFNVFKTAKTQGQQVVEIPEADDESPLKEAIVAYLRHNPHYKASKDKSATFRFLTKQDGSPLDAVNGITRILNRVFGKKVGSSMLRHSYLSQKYGGLISEMADDADAMAHTVATQRTYIRNDDDVIQHVE